MITSAATALPQSFFFYHNNVTFYKLYRYCINFQPEKLHYKCLMAKISEECQTHEILASPFVCDRILSHLTILTNLEFLFWHLHQGLLTHPHERLIILGLQAGVNWLSLLHKLSRCMFTVNLIIKEERTSEQKKEDD